MRVTKSVSSNDSLVIGHSVFIGSSMSSYTKLVVVSKISSDVKGPLLILVLGVFIGILVLIGGIEIGLEGNKKTKSSEEFLIQKKNPLVLPPDYSKLPLPKNISQEELKAENEFDLEKIIKKDSKTVKNNSVEKNSSLEKSVIEKIKDN